tara:strand:- start:113 stop:559 length:447 start_codon:yes stop_codon:yes gene_type:complete
VVLGVLRDENASSRERMEDATWLADRSFGKPVPDREPDALGIGDFTIVIGDHDGLNAQQFMNKPYNAHKIQGYFVLCSPIKTRGRGMRLSIPWMLQAISYIAIAIFLFNAYKSKRQKYIKFLALFFLVFGLVAFLILVISAITQMFFG